VFGLIDFLGEILRGVLRQSFFYFVEVHIKLRNTIANFIADGASIEEPFLYDAKALNEKIIKAVALIGMSPEFQVR
jgi:hypothetical protein